MRSGVGPRLAPLCSGREKTVAGFAVLAMPRGGRRRGPEQPGDQNFQIRSALNLSRSSSPTPAMAVERMGWVQRSEMAAMLGD